MSTDADAKRREDELDLISNQIAHNRARKLRQFIEPENRDTIDGMLREAGILATFNETEDGLIMEIVDDGSSANQ